MSDSYIIEPLGVQDRSAFSCGSEALDGYFRERASQDVKRLMASCFVATEDSDGEIAGYYTELVRATDRTWDGRVRPALIRSGNN